MQGVAVLQHAALATANVNIDNTCRNEVLVTDGKYLGAVGNQVLVLLADNKFHLYAFAIVADFHLANLADVHAADLDLGTGVQAERLREGTVQAVFLDTDHTFGEKFCVKYYSKHHDGNGKEDSDQKAGNFHPVDSFQWFECHV